MPRLVLQDDDSDDSDEGDARRLSQRVATHRDGRTLSQIKRGRVDLQKRYVFLCPTSMNKHFDMLPTEVKFAALLVFRCSRSWLLSEKGSTETALLGDKYDRNAATISLELSRGVRVRRDECATKTRFAMDISREFRNWVLTKEREGCVFWCKPELDYDMLSAFFEEKHDPTRENLPYRPLILDPTWWRTRFNRGSARFCGNPSQIVTAFNISQHPGIDPRDQVIDSPALQELIYQSNPTMEPVIKWPHAPSMRFLPKGHRMNETVDSTERRGFIDHANTDSYKAKSDAGYRVKQWPLTKPAGTWDRLDNLSGSWAAEDEKQWRKTLLAAHGARSLAGTPLTAR